MIFVCWFELMEFKLPIFVEVIIVVQSSLSCIKILQGDKKMKKILACALSIAVVLTSVLLLPGCKKKADNNYSYRMGPADIPTSWNSHTYQSNSSTYVLDYTSDTLYTFDYNDDYTGYKIVPSMAKDFPVDVTADYVGKFGIEAGDVNRAWKIVLKDNLVFDNGEKLTANSFVDSMKLLLDPNALNYRADNMWKSGDLKIYNSELYVKQNKYNLVEFVSAAYGDDEYVDPKDFTVSADGILQVNGCDIVIDMTSGGNWGDPLTDYFGENILNEAGDRLALWDEEYNIVAWRTVKKVADKDENGNEIKDEDGNVVEKYLFYDLNGNSVTITVNAAGTGYVYDGKDVNFAKTFDGAMKILFDAMDKSTSWVKLTKETLKAVQDCIAQLHGAADVDAYAQQAGDYAYMEFEEMAFLGKVFDSVDWNDVGFFAPSETELVVVLKNPMADNFYLRYELCTDFFLVYAPLYKSLIKESNGVYSNTYGTSVDTFVGYGPYKLTGYTEGSSIILEKNDKWHGFSKDEYKEGTYQTQKIVYNVVTDDSTRLEMFLKGELDSYGLQADDMKDYASSDYTYYTDSESTWYLAMNPGMNNLKNIEGNASPITPGNTVNKTVLTIQEFRKALSYALNRSDFNQVLNPTSGIAKALLSSAIIADPDSGMSYRSTDAAKDAILSFWGLSDSWGEGKEYKTRDEAIESITGYDPAGAKTLFKTAYDKAVADKLISEDAIASGKWEVQIVVGKPVDAAYYTNGYEFLKACWTEAVKDTPFEGHIEVLISETLGSTAFGEALRSGRVDVLFGVGYSGSKFNPFTFMDCFTGNLQYDAFTDKNSVMIDVELDGKVLRASAYAWVSQCLQGDEIDTKVVDAEGNTTSEVVKVRAGASDPMERRIAILAAAEEKIMTLVNIFPTSTDASAHLRCMRISYKTEDYVLGMGFGGVKYYTYSMTDEEFVQYAKDQQGGKLNYK